MIKSIIPVIFCMSLLVNSISALAQGTEFTKDEIKDFLVKHTPVVDAVLEAYNRENYQDFCRDFYSDRCEKNQEAFKAVWVDGYMEEFGQIVSKDLLIERCNFNTAYPLLVYNADFRKHDNVTIKVIFTKESGLYKIFYIRFDVLLPGEK